MSNFVIPAPKQPSVPVLGGDRFPVRRIYCVGRNYAAHAREMGADTREPPFFFMKPADALVLDGADTPYPSATENLHHEVELVVAIGKGGINIDTAAALDHVYGYAVGIDLTRRDMQDAAKAARRPWDLSKGFDASAPVGTILPTAQSGHPTSAAITLTIDGAPRQNGDLADQIWTVPEIIAELSRLVALAPGDLIMTGTPEGVGPAVRSNVLVGEIAGVGTVHTRIV
ncbi:MAG: fumarylacetoacetate hydrolase family protein [Hyphomicrobiaceae bacterium]